MRQRGFKYKAYNGGPKGHRYMLDTFKKGPISMSGRSQFSSQLSKQKFFSKWPEISSKWMLNSLFIKFSPCLPFKNDKLDLGLRRS